MSYVTLLAFLLFLVLLFVDGSETAPERTILTSTERRKEIEKIRDHELFGRHGEPVRRTNPQQRKLESERRAWEERKRLSTVYDGGNMRVDEGCF
jgi:transcription elongation GreA/GreB family factor